MSVSNMCTAVLLGKQTLARKQPLASGFIWLFCVTAAMIVIFSAADGEKVGEKRGEWKSGITKSLWGTKARENRQGGNGRKGGKQRSEREKRGCCCVKAVVLTGLVLRSQREPVQTGPILTGQTSIIKWVNMLCPWRPHADNTSLNISISGPSLCYHSVSRLFCISGLAVNLYPPLSKPKAKCMVKTTSCAAVDGLLISQSTWPWDQCLHSLLVSSSPS